MNYNINQRISDFAAEPGKMLMPIKGYEKQPLVSLEEAVEPIVPFVPESQTNGICCQREMYKTIPADGLSVDESASINALFNGMGATRRMSLSMF